MPTAQSKSSRRVIVVGSSNTDLVVHCANLPRPGETVLGHDLLTFAGGKGANQAVGAARAGGRVHFIGAFGDDAFGRARREDLEREGIDCSGSVVKKGAPSGVALIGVGGGAGSAKAENLILVAAGANARLSPADVRRGMPRDLDPGDVILCSLEVPLPAIAAALKAGGANGPLKILNPAPFPPQGLPRSLLESCDVMTPNETEFAMLAGAGESQLTRERIRKLSRRGRPMCMIVTRGAQGVVFASGDDAPRPVAAPRVKPVDTVGAGDCFNGALAARLASGRGDLEAAIRFAVAAAALKVTRQGAQAGMPRRAEIERMLKS